MFAQGYWDGKSSVFPSRKEKFNWRILEKILSGKLCVLQLQKQRSSASHCFCSGLFSSVCVFIRHCEGCVRKKAAGSQVVRSVKTQCHKNQQAHVSCFLHCCTKVRTLMITMCFVFAILKQTTAKIFKNTRIRQCCAKILSHLLFILLGKWEMEGETYWNVKR